MVDVVSKDNLKEHNLVHLDDGTLDPNEIKFLKGRKEGLSELDTVTVDKLRGDILATNKKSFKGPKTSTFLNWGTANFDKIYRKLFPSWAKMDQNNYFIKKFESKGSVEQQWILINMLLAQSIGGGQSYSYNVGKKSYKIKFSPSWLFKEGQGNYMSITTIRMLHKFQSTNAQGESIKSKADCIIGPKTIQQLFDSANIGFGNLEGTGSLNVGEEYKSGYNSEEYDEVTANEKLGKIVDIRGKSEPKNPVHYAEQLVHLYNGAKNKNAIVRYIKALYINLDEYIATIKNPMDKTRVKKSVTGIFAKIPEFKDTEGENQLNEHIRPQWKLNQLKTTIETADMYVKYLEKTSITKEKYKKIFMIQNMYNKIDELKGKFSGNQNIINLDLSADGSYLSQIFLEPTELEILKWLIDRAPSDKTHKLFKIIKNASQYNKFKKMLFSDFGRNGFEHYKNTYGFDKDTYTSFWSAHDQILMTYGSSITNSDIKKTNNITSIKKLLGDNNKENFADEKLNDLNTDILASFRDLDKNYNFKYYSGDIIMDKVGNEISELDLGDNYGDLNSKLSNLDSFLGGKSDKGTMDDLLSITTGSDILSFMGKKDLAIDMKKDGKNFSELSRTLLEKNEKGKRNVISFLIENFGINEIYANKIRESFNKEFEKIKIGNKPIKEQTKKALTKKYNKGIGQLEKDKKFLAGQLKRIDITNTQKEEITFKITLLNDKVVEYDNFINNNGTIPIELNDKTQDVSLKNMADNAYEAANEFAFAMTAEKLIGLAILETHEDDIDEIQKKVKEGGDNIPNDRKKIVMIGDIEGIGKGLSDNTVNTIVDVTKEIIIEVAICAVSMGVGNVISAGARGLYRTGRYAFKAYKASRKVSKFSKMANGLQKFLRGGKSIVKIGSKTRSLANKGPKKLANMILEGSGFHLSSTVLHNAIGEQPLGTGLNPFGSEMINGENVSNWKGYAQSIAFLGVLKGIGKPIQNFTARGTKALMGQKISKSIMGQIITNIGSMGGEMATLIGTEQIIGLFSGHGITLADMTTKDFIHMFGMVAGLRMHGGLMKKIGGPGLAKRLDDWSIKKFKAEGKEGILTLVNPKTGKEMTIKESEIDSYLKNHISYKNAKGNLVEGEIIQHTPGGKRPADGYIMIKSNKGRIFAVKETTLRGNTTLKLDFFTPGNMVYYKNGSNKEVRGEIVAKNAKGETAAKDYVMIKTSSNTIFAVKKTTLHNNVEFKMNDYAIGNKIMYKNKNGVVEGTIVESFVDGQGKLFTPKKGEIILKQTNGSYITLSKTSFEMKTSIMVNEFAPGNKIEYNKVRGTLKKSHTTKNGEIITAGEGEILFVKDGTNSPIKLSIKSLANKSSIRVLEFGKVGLRLAKTTTTNKIINKNLNKENINKQKTIKSKFEVYEQSALKVLKPLLNKKIKLPEQIKKRQETKPEYDAKGLPSGKYKTAIKNMQKFLKDFYKTEKSSTVDGILGQQTKNALNKWKAETLDIHTKNRKTIKPEKITEIVNKEVAEPIQKNETWLQNKVKNMRMMYLGIQMNRSASRIEFKSIESKIKELMKEEAKFENASNLVKRISDASGLIAKDMFKKSSVDGTQNINGVNKSVRLKVMDIGASVAELLRRPTKLKTLEKTNSDLKKTKDVLAKKKTAGAKELAAQVGGMVNKVKLAIRKIKIRLVLSSSPGVVIKIQGQHKGGKEKIYLKKMENGKWETLKSTKESLISGQNKISFVDGRPQIGEVTLTGNWRVNRIFLKPKKIAQTVMESKSLDELIVNDNVTQPQKNLIEQYVEAENLNKRKKVLEKIENSNKGKPELSKRIADKTKKLYEKEVDANLLEVNAESNLMKTLKTKFGEKTIPLKNNKELKLSDIELAINSKNIDLVYKKLDGVNLSTKLGIKNLRLEIHKEIVGSLNTRAELVSYVKDNLQFFGGVNISGAIVTKLGKFNKPAKNILDSYSGHMSKEGLSLFTNKLAEVIKIEKATVLSDLGGTTFSSESLIMHKDYLIAKGMKQGAYDLLLKNKQALEKVGSDMPDISKLQTVLDKLAA